MLSCTAAQPEHLFTTYFVNTKFPTIEETSVVSLASVASTIESPHPHTPGLWSIGLKSECEHQTMQLKSINGGAALEGSTMTEDLPLGARDLEKLQRWVPKKEMELLIEICERAQRDPDLMRPALLLCAAYAERVARMLDQDPFPSVSRKIADRLNQLRVKNGL
jgi:hypothetical protein